METNAKTKIKSFMDLYAWQEAHKLVLMIYRTTENFPTKEAFGLTSQIRRAAISITSNIAEGFSRPSYKEKIKFYHIAQGSNIEAQNQLLIARDVVYLKEVEFKNLLNQSIIVQKLINGLIKKSKSFIILNS